jgi:hypothetical protein
MTLKTPTISPTIRPAGSDDLAALGVQTFGVTNRGWVAVLDGEVLGAAGVLHTSPFQAYATMRPEMAKWPKVMVRAIGMFREMLQEHYTSVYAVADEKYPNSMRVLEKAGFQQVDGRVFKWQIQ